MGVRCTCCGCPPASVGVLTPIVEYNSPPMLRYIRPCVPWADPSGSNGAMAPPKGSETIIWPHPNDGEFSHYVYGVARKESSFGMYTPRHALW